ncbi:restriction endonuclease subunit S [Clostridium perfringens]|nr:restriction endonuclease subunit S [Clostridium perfringens]
MNETEYYKNGPSEWNYKKLGDVVTFQGGSQPAKKYFSNDKSEGMIRLIQIRDYKNDNFITYVPKELCRRFCDVDDIMIGRYGPPIFQILRGIEGAYNVALIKAIPNEEIINKNYLYYFIKNEHLFKLIDGLSQRTSGQTGIDMDVLKKYIIPIPNLTEQEKIAEILSTVNEQIENTEKLIQKNQELKKGLMQQLLTKGIGHTEFKKTELGNIPKEWEVKKLGEIFKLSSGSFLSQKNIIEGEYPVYGGNGISGYHNDYLFDESKLIIGRVGAKCGCIHISNYKSWITDNALYISEKIIDFDNKFMYYLLKYKDLNKYANQNAQPVISGQKIYSINVAMPQYYEQVKIASILLDIDKKIKGYKVRNEKLEELKRGLMQQLLTGKIRVI